MRDLDFHPDEQTVRCFGVPLSGVLRDDAQGWVTQVREPNPLPGLPEELVLRHHAFTTEWFKLNATFDLAGALIAPDPTDEAFAVNCDIATPMVRVGADVCAVDLFLDVLVGLDGNYRIIDRDEFEHAASTGLISVVEARQAEAGLRRLVQWIDSGRLFSVLDEIDPAATARAPRPLPFERLPVDLVPWVAAGTRWTWTDTEPKPD